MMTRNEKKAYLTTRGWTPLNTGKTRWHYALTDSRLATDEAYFADVHLLKYLESAHAQVQVPYTQVKGR
jgi:hypothetical protein